MSGRSAYVRKVKVDINNKAGYDYLSRDDTFKDKEHAPSIRSDPSVFGICHADHGLASHSSDHSEIVKSDEYLAGSVHSAHYEAEYYNSGYARVRRPEMPIIETSGIEKSAFRSKMEKSSENFRHNFANVFKKKKAGKEVLHETPSRTTTGKERHELAGELTQLPHKQLPMPESQATHHANRPALQRVATFKGEIEPPVPAKTKLWRRKGQPVLVWDHFDIRDPDIWDPKGDVLVFYEETGEDGMPQPAFRVASFLLGAIGSPVIDALIQGGITDDVEINKIAEFHQNDSNHPSGMTSYGSESSRSFGGSQISYTFTLPAAGDLEGKELVRYRLSWRNFFATVYGAGIVGYTLHQAMIDLHDRFVAIMPQNRDVTHILINHTKELGRFDLRDDPESACSLLIWSEHKKIHWQEGWYEAFVHCAGMYNEVTLLPIWKDVSPTTKLMLDKASVETSTKVAYCEELLADFNYESYWPVNSSIQSVSSREAFVRLQGFFRDHYSYMFEACHPVPPISKNVDGWLTRVMVKTLAADFSALYDYLVDRQVLWSSSAEMNSRRTILVRPGSPQFCPNTPECEFTSLIERFDNHHRFPPIPHPYPRLPDYSPPTRGRLTPLEARKSALSYTEATNIFLFEDEYERNDLVEQYMQWEKTDRIGECDPRSARRARWVLIYFILQTLATLVVDAPGLAHSDGVEYFLSGMVEQQPTWIQDQWLKQRAEHNQSHCWTVSSTWKTAKQVEDTRLESVPRKPEPIVTGMPMSSASSYESVTRTPTFSEAETANDLDTAFTSSAASVADRDASFLTMQPPGHLHIRTRDLALNSAQFPLSKSSPSPLSSTVSLFPAPPRKSIEQYNPAKSAEKYYTVANHPPSLPPKTPLPAPPTTYGSTPGHFPNTNTNRSTTACQSSRVRQTPHQSPYYPTPPLPGHDGEVMALRIYKSTSSTPVSPQTTSPDPNIFSEQSDPRYAPGIEKIEEPIWMGTRNGDVDGNGNGNANFRKHQKGRNDPLSGQQHSLFKIRDFDELT
ncbi:hypothetical protein DSL72_001917 [Monilinia vaccinii-corymbosi]|uniref:DUF8004 domain-containing protein n=1 Tax=Monilinia vaccinii-corymbosi TaxID=61207 RepID=A0A8A3PB67_9HELO|nr:hypothetical protein DSL72_001917 [Monilinia vaccinii-corymbosi]